MYVCTYIGIHMYTCIHIHCGEGANEDDDDGEEVPLSLSVYKCIYIYMHI